MSLSLQQIAHREYLKSVTWKDIRQQVLIRDNHKCRKCGGAGYDVHHKTYKNWGSEKMKDLITLCRSCHDALHAAQKGAKNNKAIGTRALWNYLKHHQKELLLKEFNISNELDLYRVIYLEPDAKICNRATELLGFSRWYAQLKPLKKRKIHKGPGAPFSRKKRREERARQLEAASQKQS